MNVRFWWGNLKERGQLENISVDGRIIQNGSLWDMLVWSGVICLRQVQVAGCCEHGNEPVRGIP